MDPRRVLTFRAVAYEGSFSKAARALHLSQPSVSQQISLLEAETGTRLFDRGRGGTRLTPAGELLLGHADRVAWRLELAGRQLQEFGDASSEQLSIGAFPTALAGLIPEALVTLRSTHPGAQFALSEVLLATLEPGVLGGSLDLAVAYQDSRAPRFELDDARRFDLMEETFLLALPPGHRHAAERTPIALTAFSDDHWVLPSTDGFVIEACRAAGFEPRVLSVTSDPLAMAGLIARGLAVGLVPSLLAHAYTGSALRPVDGAMPHRDVFALATPGRQHPLTREVVDALTQAAQRLVHNLDVGGS